MTTLRGIAEQLSGRPRIADATTQRILDAAREEFEQHGVRRGNVEQIARRAGTSRVTLYRRFDSKADVVRAILAYDLEKFARAADAAWTAETPIDDRIVDLFTLSILTLRRHRILQRMLQLEPETILPLLTLDAASLYDLYRNLLNPLLQSSIDAGELPDMDLDLVSELLFRLMISLVIIPVGRAPGRTQPQIEAFARRIVVPALGASR